MRVFTASVATETNTFSPIFTDLRSFTDTFYARPGEHPDTPTLCSAPIIACREILRPQGWEVIEGTATWAEPGGLIAKATWETLRDTLLQELQEAMPVQAVVLGLHGAMVAQGYHDCEGDLLRRMRDMVGPDVIIAAELDPHSHLTPARCEAADLLVAFKEFPHTDFMERARDLVHLTQSAVEQRIKPVISSFDCRMIEVLPTSREPMKGFIRQLHELEKTDDKVLSISVIHGFMAGDVPELGTRIVVITDNAPEHGEALARRLGLELFDFRGRTRPPFLSVQQALDQAESSQQAPVVLADVWDNPGGGVAGDGTLILHAIMARGIESVACGLLWDPMAVQLCFAAGEGAQIPLRFGGKSDAKAGAPIDAMVNVKSLVRNAQQQFGESLVPMGDCAWIHWQGIDLVLSSNRCQSFDPTLFTTMGLDPTARQYLLIKSTNHFYDGFEPIAGTIIYVDAGAPYPSNPKSNGYQHLERPIWPIVENPHHA
ncbi:MAG: M81 family metallopeptidase [Saccharospirillum sp.]|nr:M81 family metallopeptidase [Saccharospirillum sp.]